jgi:putative MATE family efflux protein
MSLPQRARSEPGREARPAGTRAQKRDAAVLVEGPIGSTLLMFSLPILASSVLQSINASVNAAWIGNILGARALTASANANSLLFFLLSACFGVGVAASILVGQSLGARDVSEAKRIVGTAFGFFAAISLAMAAIGVAAAPQALLAMRTPPDALPLAAAYLRVIFIALPGMYLYTFVMMSLRGAGDSRTPFAFLLISAALDVGLNPLLIKGIGPLPALGIAGSALATLIAQWSTLIALVLWLYWSRHMLCLTGAELRYLRVDPEILRALIGKGVPIGLQIIVMSSSMIVMVGLVNHYGSVTVAAYGACFQLWNYIQMPAFAVGSAVSAMAAQNVGARRWDRVARIAVIGVVYNVLLTGALVVAVTLVDHQAFALFLGDNAEAIAIALRIHLIVSWSFVLFGISFVLASVVRATGAVLAPLLIMVVALWAVRIPVALALTPGLRADAIWWSFPVGSLASLLMIVAYYRYGHWRKVPMIAHREAH